MAGVLDAKTAAHPSPDRGPRAASLLPPRLQFVAAVHRPISSSRSQITHAWLGRHLTRSLQAPEADRLAGIRR